MKRQFRKKCFFEYDHSLITGSLQTGVFLSYLINLRFLVIRDIGNRKDWPQLSSQKEQDSLWKEMWIDESKGWFYCKISKVTREIGLTKGMQWRLFKALEELKFIKIKTIRNEEVGSTRFIKINEKVIRNTILDLEIKVYWNKN